MNFISFSEIKMQSNSSYLWYIWLPTGSPSGAHPRARLPHLFSVSTSHVWQVTTFPWCLKKKERHFKSLFSKHKLHFHVTTSQFLRTTTYIQQGCNPEQQQALLWSYKRPALVVRRAVVTYKRCKHLYFLCISSAKWPNKISASQHPDVGSLSQALASTQSHPTHTDGGRVRYPVWE